MKNNFPFSITKRKESDYYYVRFKGADGKYLSWKSTKESDYGKAVKRSWELYYESQSEIQSQAFRNTVKVSDLSLSDAEFLMEEFKRRGLVKNFVVTNSECDIKALDYVNDFWDEEKSEYLKDKKRKDKTVHKQHIINSLAYIKNYWLDILDDKVLGELTRNDIQLMFDKLDNLDRNGNTKNHILRSVLTPLKYAYIHELIDRDLSLGWSFYKPKYKVRNILTKEVVIKLFSRKWKHPMAELASKVSMCTGMRAGEILSLTLKDIGMDCIYVNHSWSNIDKLKRPKNEDTRIEYVYFQSLLYDLLEIGNTNPYTEGTKYIFYATVPDKPLDEKVLLKNLRYELMQIGFTEEEAKGITFHSWRHFYTSYMKGKVDNKLLRSQTGHKTEIMLEHYSDHTIDGDIEKIKNAQQEAFRDIIV